MIAAELSPPSLIQKYVTTYHFHILRFSFTDTGSDYAIGAERHDFLDAGWQLSLFRYAAILMPASPPVSFRRFCTLYAQQDTLRRSS
jgi:hypothetical protein